jgi:hypothetical protein
VWPKWRFGFMAGLVPAIHVFPQIAWCRAGVRRERQALAFHQAALTTPDTPPLEFQEYLQTLVLGTPGLCPGWGTKAGACKDEPRSSLAERAIRAGGSGLAVLQSVETST